MFNYEYLPPKKPVTNPTEEEYEKSLNNCVRAVLFAKDDSDHYFEVACDGFLQSEDVNRAVAQKSGFFNKMIGRSGVQFYKEGKGTGLHYTYVEAEDDVCYVKYPVSPHLIFATGYYDRDGTAINARLFSNGLPHKDMGGGTSFVSNGKSDCQLPVPTLK